MESKLNALLQSGHEKALMRDENEKLRMALADANREVADVKRIHRADAQAYQSQVCTMRGKIDALEAIVEKREMQRNEAQAIAESLTKLAESMEREIAAIKAQPVVPIPEIDLDTVVWFIESDSVVKGTVTSWTVRCGGDAFYTIDPDITYQQFNIPAHFVFKTKAEAFAYMAAGEGV